MRMENAMENEQVVFDLTAGSLCLDFMNTVNERASGVPKDLLVSYSHLLEWGRQAQVLNEDMHTQLLIRAEQYPHEAENALHHAVNVREIIYRIFLALALNKTPAPADLDALNAELAQALTYARILPAGPRFRWGLNFAPDALDYVLWVVVCSTAELLTSANLYMLRMCAAEDCGWLFLDTSKNQTRRWCNMKSCGNRAKARRHLARKRQSTSV
jgi:predicted RNA-binding Zn ribbon-like protein